MVSLTYFLDTEVSCDSLSADCIESEEDVIDTEHYEQLTIDHMALNYEEEELLAIGKTMIVNIIHSFCL